MLKVCLSAEQLQIKFGAAKIAVFKPFQRLSGNFSKCTKLLFSLFSSAFVQFALNEPLCRRK